MTSLEHLECQRGATAAVKKNIFVSSIKYMSVSQDENRRGTVMG